TQAQHVGQVDGVTFVVLHPSLSPVQALGVGEVHAGAVRLQEVDDPVPAVGCLDHHLGVGPAAATAVAMARGSLPTRWVESLLPSASSRTITDRRRWKSIPTYCRSIGASSSSRGVGVRTPSLQRLGASRGAEAPLLHRI